MQKRRDHFGKSAGKHGYPKKTAPYKSKETISAGAAKHGHPKNRAVQKQRDHFGRCGKARSHRIDKS
ncbi:MAG: hypothetical protein RSD35_06815 [Oscillospiraceae bacterium]